MVKKNLNNYSVKVETNRKTDGKNLGMEGRHKGN